MKKCNPSSPQAGNLRRRAEQKLRQKPPLGKPPHSAAAARARPHELQVHQIELELQNEALRVAHELTQEVLTQQDGQLRKLALELTQTEQRERHRLAQVLHDQVQQLLVSAKYHLAALRQEQSPNQRQQIGQTLEDVLSEAIASCRSLTHELSPPLLHEAGLTKAIEGLGSALHHNQGLEVRVEATDELRLEDPRISFLLYQAVRELLFNVIKHSGVKAARVRLGSTPANQIRIQVEDQGRGFDPVQLQERKNLSGGFGLFNLRERLALLGGQLDVYSAPGQGSQFTLWVPNQVIRDENGL